MATVPDHAFERGRLDPLRCAQCGQREGSRPHHGPSRRPIPVRLSEPAISAVDAYAASIGVSRSEALRRTMQRGLQELTRDLGATDSSSLDT
jgi:hypothetical protein